MPKPKLEAGARHCIAILTGNHLCHNPRVIKEAEALASSGLNVIVYGAWVDPHLKERDLALLQRRTFSFVPVFDVAHRRQGIVWSRLRTKAASVLQSWLGMEHVWQLGNVYGALRRSSFSCGADFYIAHSEPAMAVAAELSANGYHVGVDMEDWYSEDLLPEARAGRPVRLLRKLERILLANGAYSTAPSRAMSVALSQEYGVKPPLVIYNAPRWAERQTLDGLRKDRMNKRPRSIHWFSQTIGPGRGLEDMLQALALMKQSAEIHLRGDPADGFEAWLRSRVPEKWRELVYIHPLVSNEELLSRVAEHDIGFAGEMTFCRSRELTVTNKILYYLMAGLAVVASDTAGQREVAERAPDAVSLFPCGDAAALAARLDTLIEPDDALRRAKAAALSAAEHTFCWERQEKQFLKVVTASLESSV